MAGAASRAAAGVDCRDRCTPRAQRKVNRTFVAGVSAGVATDVMTACKTGFVYPRTQLPWGHIPELTVECAARASRRAGAAKRACAQIEIDSRVASRYHQNPLRTGIDALAATRARSREIGFRQRPWRPLHSIACAANERKELTAVNHDCVLTGGPGDRPSMSGYCLTALMSALGLSSPME